MRPAIFRLRGVRAVIAVLAALPLPFLACSDFKQAPTNEDIEAGVPGPIDDVNSAFDGPTAPGDAAPDGPLPDGPPDSECSEPWKLATKTVTECAPRRVALVESGTVLVEYVS